MIFSIRSTPSFNYPFILLFRHAEYTVWNFFLSPYVKKVCHSRSVLCLYVRCERRAYSSVRGYVCERAGRSSYWDEQWIAIPGGLFHFKLLYLVRLTISFPFFLQFSQFTNFVAYSFISSPLGISLIYLSKIKTLVNLST